MPLARGDDAGVESRQHASERRVSHRSLDADDAGRRGTRELREPLALRTVADDRQPDVVARLPGTDDTARRDVEAVEVRERAVVDELYGARQRSGGRRALAKIARVGRVVNDDAALARLRGARREQCVDRAIYRDGHIGAPARPAFDALGPCADYRADGRRELGAGEFGKDFVHVEHDTRPAALRGTGRQHQEVGQRVNVHDLDVREMTMARNEPAAARDEVAVLAQVGQEAAARLATRQANHDDPADPFDGTLPRLAHRDDRDAATGCAERQHLAFDARVGGIVAVDEMQNLRSSHAGQLKVGGGRAEASAASREFSPPPAATSARSSNVSRPRSRIADRMARAFNTLADARSGSVIAGSASWMSRAAPSR